MLSMAQKCIDARGLRCPQPALKAMAASHSMEKGEVLEVLADCPTFEQDMRSWCERTKKTLLWVRVEGTAKRCQVKI
jgi:tRNA 2-thiouridine synthesizing protein A